MKEKKQVAFICSSETGEVTHEIFEGDSYRILTSEQREFLDKNVQMKKGVKFIKLMENALDELIKLKLPTSEYSIILFMCKHIRYGSCLIGFDNGNPISTEFIAKTLDTNEKAVIRSISNLVKCGLIAKVKSYNEIQYYANPFIFMKGNYVNKTLFEMFKKTKWYNSSQFKFKEI